MLRRVLGGYAAGGRPSGRPRIATSGELDRAVQDPPGGRPSGRPRIATGWPSTPHVVSPPWRPPFGAAEDRNLLVRAGTERTSTGGRPSGRPRIATTRAARWRRLRTLAAALRGGRGSQPRECVRQALARAAWRPPFGAAEDRNDARERDGQPPVLAAALRGGRGSQQRYTRRRRARETPGGRPSGRPRIATCRSRTSSLRTCSSWRPPFGAAEDRNDRSLQAFEVERLLAAALRGGRGSQPSKLAG